MNINLHIERLVLEGVDISVDEHKALQQNIIAELTQTLSSDSVAIDRCSGLFQAHTKVSEIQLGKDKLVRLGSDIAQALYRGIRYE